MVLTFTGAGCGGSGGSGSSGSSSAQTFKVTLAYPTLTSGTIPFCLEGRTAHIHPSWNGYEEVPSTASGGQTTNTSDVPAGNQQVAIMDPGACTGTNAWGNVTSGVTANGVALTSVVTINSAVLPAPMKGLSFTVLSDGTIKP